MMSNNLTSDTLSSEQVSPDEAYFPRVPPLNLELSNRCNCRCPYCANPVMERSSGQMSDAVLLRVEEESANRGYQVIGFHGTGEPLLRKDLEKIFHRFHQKKLWNGALTTNAALLSEKRFVSLRQAGMSYLYASLDTLDPDLYQRTRGGSVERVINNILAAAKIAPDFAIHVGIMNHKEQQVNDAVRATFNSVFGQTPNVHMHVYDCGKMPGAAENWSRFGEHRSDTCSAPAQFLTVLADGKVALCCADQNGQHVLGDANVHTLKEIWFSRTNQETFRNISLGVESCPEVCVSCVLNRPTRHLQEVSPILHAPLGELLAAARTSRVAGNFSESQRLFEHALSRDPEHPGLRGELAAMEEASAQPTNLYHLRYMESKVN